MVALDTEANTVGGLDPTSWAQHREWEWAVLGARVACIDHNKAAARTQTLGYCQKVAVPDGEFIQAISAETCYCGATFPPTLLDYSLVRGENV